MHSAVLLFALSAGLCATGMAAPLTQEIRSSLRVLATDPAYLPKSTLAEWSSVATTVSFEALPEPATPSAAVAAVISEELPPIDESSDAPAAIRVPEPATFLPAGLGCLVIAFVGYYRLNYRIHRKHRHHRIRPLTVLR